MAAAKIKGGAYKLFRTHTSDPLSKPEALNPEQKEKEKRFIASYLDQQFSPISPPQEDGVHELKIGCSSRQLVLKDFKLLKTLGTGQFKLCRTKRRSEWLCLTHQVQGPLLVYGCQL